MRDLRAKAAADKAKSSGEIRQAKDQLGHTTVVMTEQYIRNSKDKKVSPVEQIADRKRSGINTGFRP